MSETKPVRIALLGCGTVGGGVISLITDNAQLAARIGSPLEIKHVLVRDAAKPRVPECRAEWVTTEPAVALDDPEVDIVVEVMGGEQPAKQYVERALSAGKSVVSANKYLLAKHGAELLELAVKSHADLAFEASVGGGIPVIRTLREGLTSDSVASIHGILNGTCNYILTRMKNEGLNFAAVLKDAQDLGYAEADPAMDVDGHDAAQKLVVLSMLAFGAKVNLADVYVEGIRQIDEVDFRAAERYGFTIKHLAIAKPHPTPTGTALEMRVHPTMIAGDSVLGAINDVLNGAFIQGRALGPCLLMGPGAGALPTAVSVVADIVEVARAGLRGTSGSATSIIKTAPTPLLPMADIESRYYLRFDVADQPGVLATIASALGDQGVSVEQMLQEGARGEAEDEVPVLIITHRAREGAVRAAVALIESSPWLQHPPRLIRIEDL